MNEHKLTVETLRFDDDGRTPNNPRVPVKLYRNASSGKPGDELAERMERRFRENGWPPAWRWGVYDFHHYHSTAHEALGCFAGHATLKLGGENGEEVEVGPGDAVMLPAGTGHCCLWHTPDFQVVGAYPPGQEHDMIRGGEGDLEAARRNIRDLPSPSSDPVTGETV